MFCLAGVLDQRLFADFQADCCLIIRRRPFEERLLRATTLQLRNVDAYFGRVLYVDSLGARPARVRVTRSIPIHMTKLFRYANQREIRFALLSRRFQEQLTPGLSGSSPFPTSRSSCRFPTTTRLGSSPHVTSPSAFDGAGHARRGPGLSSFAPTRVPSLVLCGLRSLSSAQLAPRSSRLPCPCARPRAHNRPVGRNHRSTPPPTTLSLDSAALQGHPPPPMHPELDSSSRPAAEAHTMYPRRLSPGKVRAGATSLLLPVLVLLPVDGKSYVMRRRLLPVLSHQIQPGICPLRPRPVRVPHRAF